VVGDVRFRGLERTDNEPQVYIAASQQRDGQIGFYAPQDLLVRTSIPATSLLPAVRAIIRKADPQLPITSVRTLDDVVALEMAPRVVQLRVLGAFAGAAFLLAAIGIHGLLAYTVRARSREIGVRIALGAKAQDIISMVLGRSAMMAVLGVVIGAALAYAAGRSMQAMLFGVDPANPAVFGAAAGLALIMTLAGSLLPAWRAVRIDPIAATRTE
jgi:ABC-type antimicrobial peptide transport system permease subunit